MLTLELDQASEDRLAEAASKLGMTTERYATLLLWKAIMARDDPSPPSSGMTIEEWERILDRLIEEQDHSIPAIADEALRREGLYEDRS